MDVNDHIPDALCSKILRSMRENFAGPSKLLLKHRNFDYLRSSFINEFEEKLSKTGFKKVSFTSTNGVTNVIFRRDAISAISQQSSKTNFRDILSNKTSGSLRAHPLNSDIGRNACRCVEEETKSSSDAEVHWSTIAENGVQSVVGCLKMYSDKSQKSLATGEIICHPLHLTLFNFSEQNWRHHISNGSMIIAQMASFVQKFHLDVLHWAVWKTSVSQRFKILCSTSSSRHYWELHGER